MKATGLETLTLSDHEDTPGHTNNSLVNNANTQIPEKCRRNRVRIFCSDYVSFKETWNNFKRTTGK